MEKIKLFRELAKHFPKSIKSRGDRVGLMTGKLPDNINHILLCLDFDETVLNKVKEIKDKYSYYIEGIGSTYLLNFESFFDRE